MSAPNFLAPVTALPALQVAADASTVATAAATTAATTAPSAGAGFQDMVVQGLERVNESLQASQSDMQQLAAGQVDNLHQMMIRLEESRLSFQLMLQVRNRLLESYQEVMRMQV